MPADWGKSLYGREGKCSNVSLQDVLAPVHSAKLYAVQMLLQLCTLPVDELSYLVYKVIHTGQLWLNDTQISCRGKELHNTT